MKVISVIEDKEVIKKTLKHLGLWNSKAISVKTFECSIDYSSSQVHPDSDKWLYADPEYPEVYSS